MSRSRKKNPYHSTCKHSAEEMKKYKVYVRGIERRTENIPSGNAYKKFHERWHFPDDGRFLWNEPKGFRK